MRRAKSESLSSARGLILLALCCPLSCAHPGTNTAQAAGSHPSPVHEHHESRKHRNSQSFRRNPPQPGPEPQILVPAPNEAILPNGLTVLSVPKNDLPLVHFQLVVKSGSGRDPKKRQGLAGFFSEMLKAGTTKRSAKEIATSIETLGSNLHIDIDEDSITIAFTALSENFPPVLDLVADMILNPAFSAQETERVRKRRLGRNRTSP